MTDKVATNSKTYQSFRSHSVATLAIDFLLADYFGLLNVLIEIKEQTKPSIISILGLIIRYRQQRWSPRGQILKSLALASKVKSLALASRPQVLENWPVLGSRTALFFELLKFCGALEKILEKFFVEIA